MRDCCSGADADGFGAWLRDRSDMELTALLAARPDLVTPAPADVASLASRATTRLSLERALDDLDQFALRVLGALAALDRPAPAVHLQEMLGVAAVPLRRCLRALRCRALAWETPLGLRAAPGLRAAVGEAARLDGPDGVPPSQPPLVPIPNDAREAGQTAAAAALAAVRAVEGILRSWGTAPPPVLKSGGLAMRDLRRAADQAGTELRAAALYIELARAAGLLAASGWTGGEWLPSHAFDTWCEARLADRWVELIAAWLTTTRVPGLAGARDEHGQLRGALGPGLDRVDAPRIRSWVLGELADLAPGESASLQNMLQRLAWRWPRGQQLQAALAEMTMTEAALLGMTGLGALAAHGRALVWDGPAPAAAALAATLPEPVGYVVLQADLTAVAPGLLEAGLERELTLAADVESAGAATVYRFCADSVRRALDAGRSGGELLRFLQDHSRTPVPQPLRYLIEDAARQHGRIRVGSAASYIRCDDPGLLAEIVADRRTAALRLRSLAPTVLISAADRGDVLRVLRDLGYLPAAESDDGGIEIIAGCRRARGRPRGARRGVSPAPPPWPAEKRALAAVRVLRSGNRAPEER